MFQQFICHFQFGIIQSTNSVEFKVCNKMLIGQNKQQKQNNMCITRKVLSSHDKVGELNGRNLLLITKF